MWFCIRLSDCDSSCMTVSQRGSVSDSVTVTADASLCVLWCEWNVTLQRSHRLSMVSSTKHWVLPAEHLSRSAVFVHSTFKGRYTPVTKSNSTRSTLLKSKGPVHTGDIVKRTFNIPVTKITHFWQSQSSWTYSTLASRLIKSVLASRLIKSVLASRLIKSKVDNFVDQSRIWHSRLCQKSTMPSSSRTRVINHNWSATKQRLHPQSIAKISHHSVLSGDRIWQCEILSGSRHKNTDQCL